MKTRRILYSIFGVVLLAACSGGDYERQLERFEEMNRTDVPMTPDSVRPIVRHYDHWWHSRNHRMRAYYMLGCAYRDQGSAPRALENYQRAVNIADTTDARCDLNVLMRVHFQMSQIFLLQRLPELEEQELHIAEDLAWQIGDTLSALIFEERLCNILYNKKEYITCIKQTLRLHSQFISAGYKNEAKLTLVNCIKSLFTIGYYSDAKKYLDQYETCSYLQNNPEKVIGGIRALFIYKGQYFNGVNQPDSAEYYFKKALSYQDVWDSNLLITKGLCKTYELKHNADSLAKYVKLYSEAKERSFDEAQTAATIQTKALYDYSVEKEIAERKAREVSRLVAALVTTLLIAFLVIAFARYRNEKKKRKISELREQYQQITDELKSKEEDIRELLEEKDSNQELLDKYLREKEEMIAALSSLDMDFKTKAEPSRVGSLADTDIVKRFRTYRQTQTKPQIEDGDWEELHRAIDSANPTFSLRVNALQHLSKNDYRVCMLDYLGFGSADIAYFMGFSESAASMIRRRLNKKVFGVDGTPAEFDSKLRRL